jgi:hypothetical protein
LKQQKWQGKRHRKLLAITVEPKVFEAIEKINAGYEYPNRSALASDLLKAGLATRGIILET